jgi:hypothetical protein
MFVFSIAAQTMVWAGVIRTNAIPMDLKDAPGSVLVYRRIINDFDDRNKVLDGDFAILLSQSYLARTLCDEAHNLVTLFYCERPQYLAMMNADVAAPAPSGHVNRKRKVEYDFGIRRWLADTGCGHDLVQTSLVVRRGGEAYIRMRTPKYPNTADGLTSIAWEVTMYLPQLGEMADMLCCRNTPSVISIDNRCIDEGSAFSWPPYS